MNARHPNNRPALRQLEAVPVEQNGERMVNLYDPAGYSELAMTLSLPAFYLLTLFDGKKDLDRICEEFKNKFGGEITKDEIEELVEKLDDTLMLDNERFSDFEKKVKSKFLASSERPFVFAGKSYPAAPKELLASMNELVSGGVKQNNGTVRAIVVPHIDFRIGADMMAAGWKTLKDTDADLFIILGTGHSLSEDFFSCLDKDIATPLGSLRVDREFLAKFQEKFGEDIGGDIDAHRMEHSIEFHALFLAHLYKERPEVTVVPILLSFPEQVWDIDHPVFNGKRVDKFIEALKKTVEETNRKTVFVASVDFSHVGARFGDSHKLSDEELKRIEDDDRELLDAIERMNMENFHKKIVETNSVNRVCGFPPLYTLLKVCDADHGSLIEYRQNIEGQRETVVSFATMTLHSSRHG